MAELQAALLTMLRQAVRFRGRIEFPTADQGEQAAGAPGEPGQPGA